MAAQYDLKPGLGPKTEDDAPVLYPKLVPHGTKKLKDIIRHAQMYTGLNASAVQGVVTFLEEVLAEYLAEGYNVKLGNIGTFSATLTSRKVASKEEIRAKSIHFGDVSFQAAKELKKGISQRMKLERVSPYRAFKASSDEYTADERFRLLADYLDKHGYITRADYSELTGLLKTKAAGELKKWYAEGKSTRTDGCRTSSTRKRKFTRERHRKTLIHRKSEVPEDVKVIFITPYKKCHSEQREESREHQLYVHRFFTSFRMTRKGKTYVQ